MSRSLSFDDPLRPLSPEDLQTTAVHAGTALVCAEAAFQAAAEPVAAALGRHGWTSSLAPDLDRARWLASVRQPHVVIILGQTPRWSAQAAMTIRGVTTAPILVLAEFGPDAHARVFESGADMVAGVGASETWLVAAVTALVRRHRPARPALRYLECDGLRLDLVAHRVTVDGEPCEMPPSEFMLLRFLMTHPQVALRHSTIIKAVWDWKYSDERNALRICVNRLRKRLGDTAGEPRFIESLRGFGYSFVPPVSQFAADLSEPGSLDADSSLHELAAESRSLQAGLLAARTLTDAATFLVTSVVRDGICDAAAVMVRDGKMLQLIAQAGNTPAWQASVQHGVPLARGFVAADSVLSGQTRHFVNIVAMSKHYSSTAGLMREADLPVLLSVPLANRAVVWGHIGFAARGGSAFPPAQLMLLEGVGHLLGALAGQDPGEPASGRAGPANSRAASLCRAHVEAATAVAWRWPDTYAPNSKNKFTAAVSKLCGRAARNGLAVLFAFIIPGCSMALANEFERNLLEIPVPPSGRIDVYSGVARLSGAIWASEVRIRGRKPDTAFVFIHPTANFLGHYALPALASFGVAAIGLTTRYIGNDSNLNVENCLLDIGATVRYLREHGYRRVVLVGNSGGGTVVPYYQAQAEHPSVTTPPGGGPDLTAAGLLPADALVLFMAHPSRARLSVEWLDPAITDESAPFTRDADLDAFNPRNGPPFRPEFIERYRAAQLARNRRITAWAEEQLAGLTGGGHWPPGLDDLAFVVHGTSADLRFLDSAIDASDRATGSTLWGTPEVANYLPAGISRYTTLHSWINQWSVDRTLGNALLWLPKVEAPVLVLGGSADSGSPPAIFGQLYDAVELAVKKQIVLDGATHYFEGQPDKLRQACEAMAAW